MKQGFLKFILVTSVLPITLFFQNCGQGFETLPYLASTGAQNAPDPQLQASALTILANNCRACHGDQNLGNVSDILNVNHLLESNLIVAGDPDSSRLYSSIANNSMPPSGPLTEADKQTLRNWILQLGGVSVTPPGELDLRFTYQKNQDPLPFRARLGKLVSFVGSESHASLNKVKTDRLLLGDYDFSRSVIPKSSWEATDMKAWLEAVEPVCNASDIQSRFAWPNGLENFIRATLGRDLRPSDSSVIAEINSQSIPNNEKFDVFCLTILTSMEFVTK